MTLRERKALIESTLAAVVGNRTAAAAALGTNRTYLIRLIRESGIVSPATPGHHGHRSTVTA